MKFGIRVDGFEEVDENLILLHHLADHDELVVLGTEALEPVAQTARSIVRTRTGRLQRSITVGDRLSPAQAAVNQPEPGTIEIYVGPGPMTRAITEEFGTVHETGHPYMRPAWDSRVATVLQRLRDGSTALLRRLMNH